MNYTPSQNWLTLLARILFSLIFILSAVNKITAFDSTVTYMIGSGVTFHPEILLIIATVLELGGGILILFGLFTRFAGIAIFVFTAAVSYGIHHFWNYPVEMQQLQLIQLLKNIAMMGGALYIVAFGAGAYSLDGLLRKKKGF